MAWRLEFTAPALRELDKLDRQVACGVVTVLHDRVVRVGNRKDVYR